VSSETIELKGDLLPYQNKLKPLPVASLPSNPSSPETPRFDKYSRSPYFNTRKYRQERTERELADELFGDDVKPAATSLPVAQNPPTNYSKVSNKDLVAEHNKTKVMNSVFPNAQATQKRNSEDGDKSNNDVLYKVNQSIAQKQAQLEKLQASLTSLKNQAVQSEPQADVQDTEMLDADHTGITEVQPLRRNSGDEEKSMAIAPNDLSSFILVKHKNNTTGKVQQKQAQMSLLQGSLIQPTPNTQLDPLTVLAIKRPEYPRLPDPTPRRQFFQRTTWRIDIPGKSESPQQGLIEAITEVWTILKEADDKLIIYPWRLRNHGQYKALSGPSKLPNTKELINRYFSDAYFRPHPGSMYVRVFIGSSISEEELGIRTHYFFGASKNRTRVAFWKNHLQFEDTIEIGWLFRSTPGMSPETIQKELLAHTGIHAAVRWRMISVVEFKGDLPKNFQVKALHISVRREDGNLAKAKFTKLVFAKHRRSHFIGGSPMRMIPISKDLSTRNQSKGLYYCSRQQTFLQEIVIKETFDILQIDNQAIGLQGRTLRDLILEIPIRDAPNRQAFLSADRSFKQSSVRLVYYKKHNSECKSKISTLLPYLIFTNPSLEKGIRACFTAEANERAKGVKWDNKRKEVITVDDEIFDCFDDYESDDEEAQANAKKFIFELSAVTGQTLDKDTKVQEGDAASLFSQSTFRSTKRKDSDTDESDDTPKTINRATPTAQTEALSSLSEGISLDLKARLDLMTKALVQLTTMIPDTPENQVSLNNIRALLPPSSAGCSSGVDGSGSSGPGALLR
jgi:hypothetical protein